MKVTAQTVNGKIVSLTLDADVVVFKGRSLGYTTFQPPVDFNEQDLAKLKQIHDQLVPPQPRDDRQQPLFATTSGIGVIENWPIAEVVCKGSYALGTACGKCKRCEQDPARPIYENVTCGIPEGV